MVSLRLVEYSLAYKPYVGFIVTQVLNIYIYIYIYIAMKDFSIMDAGH